MLILVVKLMLLHSRVLRFKTATVCDFENDGIEIRRVFWPFESGMKNRKYFNNLSKLIIAKRTLE